MTSTIGPSRASEHPADAIALEKELSKMESFSTKIDVILIVDDQPSNIRILNGAVAQLGDVIFATSGEEALAMARQHRPDLILLDVEMPGMDGYEVCQTIKKDSELSDIPIIFVTAHSEVQNELRALESGGVDFLHKPIHSAIAHARVKTHLELRREKQQLALAKSTMHNIIHHLPAFVAYWDIHFNNIFSNDHDGLWFGYTADRMLGESIYQVIGIDPADVPLLNTDSPDIKGLLSCLPQVTSGHTVSKNLPVKDASGSLHFVQASLVPTLIDGTFNGFVMLLNDVPELKAAQSALHTEKEHLRVTLNSIGDAVIATDLAGLITFMNPIAESLTGWYSDEALGKPIEKVMLLHDSSGAYRLKNPIYIALHEQRVVGMALNSSLRRRDGRDFEVEDSAAPIRDDEGATQGAIIVFHDVSEARAMALKMSHLANHDALTNLPNRMLLQDRADRALHNARSKREKAAMMLLDIDHFKTINDSVGHSVGDLLIQNVALRLKQAVRACDTVSRQGGDEFIILLPDIRSLDELAYHAEKVMMTMEEPFWLEQTRYDLSASVGISIYPDDSPDVESLYRHADSAMYKAKQEGRNRWHFFSQEIEISMLARHRLEQHMRQALDNGQYEVFYQAKVDARQHRVVGVEALLRLRGSDQSLISPAEFIPLAEETGLIVPIGRWVLLQACQDAHSWHQAGFDMKVSINISAVQFREPNFHEDVDNILRITNIDSSQVELEITESVLAKDTQGSRLMLLELKKLRLQISIDDFGTGYSSLSYLKRFPLDVLKIDQSFIRDMLKDPSDATIVATIINLARSLGLSTVAEGVETEAHVDALLNMGCDVMQGYYYCRPMPYQQMCGFLKEHFGQLQSDTASI
ncbi:EAL domain-containing protein [Pokkaliibacter sp. MBI-7]|uniref:EAL domain-containing protein n=1 Tax=Pokkaliibacter sp. MBI-7 TaxID=3040600 RepID=UPI00244A34C8|nr:EAL domain-containing protein [Pokkaliibacter sp. MBI-7]MDH2435208.1 EAL domain-containing protein [Pokkaliibacter sp. MBI-7]